MPRRWTLWFDGRVVTTNAERAGNRFERATATKAWREAFGWSAKAKQIPALDKIVVYATPYQQGGRIQDVGACAPSVKAAIDGIVDAGVIPDDDPSHLIRLVFEAPVRGKSGLEIVIEEVL